MALAEFAQLYHGIGPDAFPCSKYPLGGEAKIEKMGMNDLVLDNVNVQHTTSRSNQLFSLLNSKNKCLWANR